MTDSPFLVIPTVAQFLVLAVIVIVFSVGFAAAIGEFARWFWEWRGERGVKRFMRSKPHAR